MPAVTPWYQGAQVPLAFPLTDSTGTVTEAASLSSVTATVLAPDGTRSTPTVTWDQDASQYTAAYTTAQPGHHIVIWICTDATCPGSYTDTFEVQPQQDPTIVSLAEAKQILHLTSTTEFDSIIQGYNAAATNWIEYVCGPVVQRVIAETLPVRGTEQILTRPPVIELVPWTVVPPELAALGITLPSPASPMIRTTVYGIEYPASQLYCDYARGIVKHTSGLPFYYCAYRWQYKAGRPVIPAGIYEAAKITLEHLFMVERGGADSAATAGEDQTVTGAGFAVPNRAMTLLQPYTAASRMVAA